MVPPISFRDDWKNSEKYMVPPHLCKPFKKLRKTVSYPSMSFCDYWKHSEQNVWSPLWFFVIIEQNSDKKTYGPPCDFLWLLKKLRKNVWYSYDFLLLLKKLEKTYRTALWVFVIIENTQNKTYGTRYDFLWLWKNLYTNA